jgi:hypothetical protein
MTIENYDQAREMIDEKYRKEFDEFTRTRIGSEEFLNYVYNNKFAKEAVQWCVDNGTAQLSDILRGFNDIAKEEFQNDKKI